MVIVGTGPAPAPATNGTGTGVGGASGGSAPTPGEPCDILSAVIGPINQQAWFHDPSGDEAAAQRCILGSYMNSIITFSMHMVLICVCQMSISFIFPACPPAKCRQCALRVRVTTCEPARLHCPGRSSCHHKQEPFLLEGATIQNSCQSLTASFVTWL